MALRGQKRVYALPLLINSTGLLHTCLGCESCPFVWVVESQPPQEVSLPSVHGHVASLELIYAALQLVYAALVSCTARQLPGELPGELPDKVVLPNYPENYPLAGG